MICNDGCGEISGMGECQRKAKYSEKTWPNAALSTTDPTRLDRRSSTGPRCGKPATNRLSYGTAVNVFDITKCLRGIWDSRFSVSGLEECILLGKTPCTPVKFSRRFGGKCRLGLQYSRISQARNRSAASFMLVFN
jgi:hypothetical protein